MLSLISLAGITGCKEQHPDTHSLEFKQKQADSYVNYLEEHPDSAGLRLLVAGKLDSVGRYKEALDHIDTLLRSDSNKYAFWVVKGSILLDNADTTAAQQSYAKAIQIFPGKEALFQLAETFAYQKKDTCLKIVANFMENPQEKYYIEGLYAAQTGDTAQAFTSLKNCMLLDPHFAKAYQTQAALYLSLGDIARARQTALAGLQTAPEDIALLNLTGQVFEQAKQGDSANAYYQRSLLIKPFQPSIKQRITAQ